MGSMTCPSSCSVALRYLVRLHGDYPRTFPPAPLFSKLRKPSQQNTYDLPFRDAGLWVFLKYDTRKSLITCGIYIRKDKERYEYIKKHEDIIKRYFPEYKILFDEKQERQGTSITISKENSDVNNQNQRPSMFQWFCENAVKWKKVLDEIG